MYATEFGRNLDLGEPKYARRDKQKILGVAPIMWAEHCLECSAPLCYTTCPKFRKRKDGRCQLFENSICRVKDTQSIYGESINVIFEGWSKLEADVCFKKLSVKEIQNLNKKLKKVSSLGVKISTTFERKRTPWWLTNKVYNYKEKVIRKYGNTETPDVFFVGAILNNESTGKLFLEIKKLDNTIVYRNKLELKKGYNEIIIDFDTFKIKPNTDYKVYLYAEEKKLNITFTMLDFLWLKKSKKKKIKCIAWDLDNTLWDGVLIEGNVKLKKNIKNIIKELDARGIINSIISKNNKEDVMPILEKEGLYDYFVMPQINWNPKSVNIENLAKQMNIGIDTIAFIDDNPFEREEVHQAYPEVTIYKESEYLDLLNKDEFNVVVTEDTKNRRKTYKMLEKQNEEWEQFDGNIDEFLKQCKMKVTFRKPKEEEYMRCFELLQRTNQLNSSGRRLTIDELVGYINDKNYESYIIQVEDKFGNYGIVGFSLVNLKNIPTITDFVISCRVANKKVENTYFLYLAEKYKKEGKKKLRMNYVKTAKNGPIFKIVKELKLKEVEKEEDFSIYEMDLQGKIEKLDIMEIVDSEM